MISYTDKLSSTEPVTDTAASLIDEVDSPSIAIQRTEASCASQRTCIEDEQARELAELERHGLLSELSRRRFIQASSAIAASLAIGIPAMAEAQEPVRTSPVALKINGRLQTVTLDSRTSL